MAVPIALAGAGKLAMQVLPFLPGIASAVQGDYGKGAAQAATAYGLGKIPGVGRLAGMGPAGQAAALGIQSLGGAVGGGMGGSDVTCGKTTDGKAYCWGQTNGGELGDGDTEYHKVASPTLVLGGIDFSDADASAEVSPGVLWFITRGSATEEEEP